MNHSRTEFRIEIFQQGKRRSKGEIVKCVHTWEHKRHRHVHTYTGRRLTCKTPCTSEKDLYAVLSFAAAATTTTTTTTKRNGLPD